MMWNNQNWNQNFGNNWNYYGCWENQYLNNFQFGFKQQSMTYQQCQSHCYQNQYNYCYVQGGDSCYCGSSSWYQQYGSYGNFQDSQCSSGYKVYQWNNWNSNNWNNNQNSMMWNNNQYGNQWNYYGCWENQYLNNFQFGFKQNSMTYQQCNSYCYQNQYYYSYVMGGNSCYCGSSSWYQQYGSYENFQDSQCSSGNRVYYWNNNWNNQNSMVSNARFTGYYGKWQKQGRCSGECGQRGRQNFIRYCNKPGQCNPLMRNTRYASCMVGGCSSKAQSLW